MQNITEFYLKCNVCGHIFYYKSEQGKRAAIKRNKCKSCSIKASHLKDPNRMKGENNPMFGTNLSEIWNDKFGSLIATEKLESLSQTRTLNAIGENNPMFGKPPGKDAGRGISGTFKNLHFRSSYELAFLIDFETRNKTLPINAETINFRATLNGKTYVPDFYHDKIVYEIKPKKLINSNESKLQALTEFCQVNKFKLKIITENDITLPKNIKKWMLGHHEKGDIQLSEKQLKRLKSMRT